MSDIGRFLNELETDYIDLLLIHWRGSTPLAETLGAMDELKFSVLALTLCNVAIIMGIDFMSTERGGESNEY